MIQPGRYLIVIGLVLATHASLVAQDKNAQDPVVQTAPATEWYDKQTQWKSEFDRYHFKHAGTDAYLIVPEKPLPGKPWIWRARFPDFHADMDIDLIRRGYHLAYFNVAGKFGSPETIERASGFYDYLINDHQLNSKPVLEGVSRGGLFVYNWAAKNPGKVSCIYCDTPVCDFRSWPGGHGDGIGSQGAWKQCLSAYGITEAEAKTYQGLPIHHAKIIAEAKIPVMHIVSQSDVVVPPTENTYVLRDALQSHGHTMDLIEVAIGTEKSHGHHFTHPDPDRVVQFILKHTAP